MFVEESQMTYRARYAGWWRSWRGYASALFLTGSAFLLRLKLAGVLQDYSCFLLFAPSSMLASWLGGLPAGLISFFAGLVLGDYFFLPPFGQFGPYRIVDIAQILGYSITTLVGIGLIESIQVARHNAQLAAEEARLRNSLLEKEVVERQRVQEALETTQAELHRHSLKLAVPVADGV